ncbi:fatty-acyl-CoA synthase [Ruminococcaceae bacterium YRB3002]|nr:fatty-acyl-CoA synthase [Ruminococcaceae bacterium YRB3002]
MEVLKQIDGNIITVSVTGTVDTNTAPAFREHVKGIPDGMDKVVFDLRNVTYVSSAGLRELLTCVKRFSKDRMEVINVQESVMEVFSMTGFDNIINVTAASDDRTTYLHMSFKELLAHKIKKHPDNVVIKTDDGSYTWTDIEKCSQIMAADLSGMGVGRGTHVGICCANSINWVIAFFAIQKLGAMAMLFNPNYFPHEVRNVAGIGDVTHLCYGEMPAVKDKSAFVDEILNKENSVITAVYDISKDNDLRSRYDEYERVEGRFGESVNVDSPSAIIFTSGSTGRPKGVILSAFNILNAAIATRDNQTLNSDDRTCMILPLFHIFGLAAGLFANMMADSVMCLPKDIRTDTLLDLIEGEQCTVFHTVPTMMIALINNKNFDASRCATLRCTILSGAAATEAQIKLFKEKLPNDHFISSYGMSEMAPLTVTDYDDTDDHVLHTVGKPIPLIELKIWDYVNKKDCPDGYTGEILVQGYNLMAGYYKMDIEDQSIDEDGWLHTGDLGFIDGEGYVHLTGRLKELIIRGGENIMPGEVEQAVTAIDGISMVKVFGVPSDFFGEEVGACIKMKDGFEFDENAVKAELSSRLARFKIPAYYVVFDEFPVLGTGKIDGVTLKKMMLERLGK